MNNRERLRAILGPNPTANCQPTQRVPARIRREANKQRTDITLARYDNVIQFTGELLRDYAKLDQHEVQSVLGDLTKWLGKDDPLGFLHSLQQGQLQILLGEIGPVVAGWLADNIGIFGGGSQGRKGGYSRVRQTRSFSVPSFRSIISLGQQLAPFVRQLGGGTLPTFGSGGAGGSLDTFPTVPFNPSGPPHTIDLPADPSNVLEIPQVS